MCIMNEKKMNTFLMKKCAFYGYNWQWSLCVIETKQKYEKCYAVLERPSSQMSYLDHFLKETGGSNASTHTTSTLAANLVSI